jgi:hypothetical protein
VKQLSCHQAINFKQSLIDNSIFYKDNIIFIVYVDDGIFLAPSDQQLCDIINELRNLKLSIEDQGHPANYVGVSIKKLKNDVIELTQQALIDSIISDVAQSNSKVKAVPAKVSKILHAHLDKPHFSLNFGYCLVIGKLKGSTLLAFSQPTKRTSIHEDNPTAHTMVFK